MSNTFVKKNMNYFSKNFSTGRQAVVKPCNRRPLVKPCKSSIVNNRQAAFIVKGRQSSIVNRQRMYIWPGQKWAYGGGPMVVGLWWWSM
jgi:hypothetical protein